MPWSTNVAHWAVNGINVEIPSTYACMHQNLTWLDKTHAFTMCEDFKAQGCLTFLQNIWDHPHLHQCSSCSLMVIIRHSHQWNICQNSNWNVMEHLPWSPSPIPWSINVAHWALNGANVEIPSTYACMHQNLTWLDKTCAFTVWEGFKAQGCMACPQNLWDHPRLHQHSSCSLMVIIHHSHQRNLC